MFKKGGKRGKKITHTKNIKKFRDVNRKNTPTDENPENSPIGAQFSLEHDYYSAKSPKESKGIQFDADDFSNYLKYDKGLNASLLENFESVHISSPSSSEDEDYVEENLEYEIPKNETIFCEIKMLLDFANKFVSYLCIP